MSELDDMQASNDMFTNDGAQSQHATKELTMMSTISKTGDRYVVGGKTCLTIQTISPAAQQGRRQPGNMRA